MSLPGRELDRFYGPGVLGGVARRVAAADRLARVGCCAPAGHSPVVWLNRGVDGPTASRTADRGFLPVHPSREPPWSLSESTRTSAHTPPQPSTRAVRCWSR